MNDTVTFAGDPNYDWSFLSQSQTIQQAQLCPVCGGSGEYRTGSLLTTLGPSIKRCHGCSGKGWITV